MAISTFVGVRGESFTNEDGTSRQDVIRRLRSGLPVELIPEPTNPHDRWAVRVMAAGHQIGYLPSDARDADALLKGEPIVATIHDICGGTTWLKRLAGKKHVGVVLKLEKQEPDWNRRNRLQGIARPIDCEVEAALVLEQEGQMVTAIDAMRKALGRVRALTHADPYASAHRSVAAPVDRLSLLLERQKQYADALRVIVEWEQTFDPVQPSKSVREALLKRAERLRRKAASSKERYV